MKDKPQLSAEIKEEEIYMPEQLPENNKPDDKPVKSALHGKIREQFYKDFYVCVPSANHYPESCICEFTDEEIEPVIEWFVDFLATALEEQEKEYFEKINIKNKTIEHMMEEIRYLRSSQPARRKPIIRIKNGDRWYIPMITQAHDTPDGLYIEAELAILNGKEA